MALRQRVDKMSDNGQRQRSGQKVNDLFDSEERSEAIESEQLCALLDHVPIAIAVSKLVRGDHRRISSRIMSRIFSAS